MFEDREDFGVEAQPEVENTVTAKDSVVELFGQYAIKDLEGKVILFPSYEEAKTASIMIDKEVEFSEKAQDYCDSRALTGRNAKSKIGVIKDFLAYCEATA